MTQKYSGIGQGLITDALVFGDQLHWIINHSEQDNTEQGKEIRTKLKRIFYGGMKLPTSLLKKTLNLFPQTDLYGYWGMTEMCGIGAGLLPEDHRRLYKLESTGKILMPGEIRILREDGTEAKVDEAGEICVHKSRTADGYLNDPERTAALFVGDWMKTGDYGKICPEGYLYILSRKKDVIIRDNGIKVYCTEVRTT